MRGHCVKIAFNIEGQALRPAKAGEKSVDHAARRNSIDAIKARSRRTRHVEVFIKSEGEVVGGNARFKRRKDEDFPVRVDFEDGAAAVSDVQIALAIER